MRMARLLSLALVATVVVASAPALAQQPVAPPPPQIPYGPPISLEQAKKVMAGAEAEAMKNKWNVVITVLDSGGHVVAVHRLDGTHSAASRRRARKRTPLFCTGARPRYSRTLWRRAARTSVCCRLQARVRLKAESQSSSITLSLVPLASPA